MRTLIVLPVFALTLAVLSVRASETNKADDLDKKVLEIVKQVGDLHKNAKTLHTEATVVTEGEKDGKKAKITSEAAYDIERPNHLALKTKVVGDDKAGLDLVSDGKKLIIHRKRAKEYTDESADDMPSIGQQILRQGTANTGMLFQNVLMEDPYEALMDGVTSCTYAGKEKVGDTDAHHLKFEQEGLHWELWVAAEGKPFVLKAMSVAERDGGKATTVETYKNWKVDEPLAKDAFKYSPDGESKKVESFSENSN